jgi:hypothetical protein
MNINDINEESLSIFNRHDIWMPLNDETYHNWLTKFCIFLVNSGFCNDEVCVSSVELFKSQVNFISHYFAKLFNSRWTSFLKPYLCEQAIPFIIHKIISNATTAAKKSLTASIISQNIKKFFEKCHTDGKKVSIECIKCMISILEFLREQFIKKEM